MQSLTQLGAQAPCLRRASILLALLFLSSSAIAQEAKEPPVTENGTLVSQYDKFDEKLKVDLRSMIVSNRNDEVLLLNAHAEYTGAAKPAKMNLIIARVNNSPRDCGVACSLDVIADGEHMKLALLDMGVRKAAALYVQMTGRPLDWSDFRKIASAKKVEMRFERTEFQLTDDQLSSLREFVKTLER